jgi:hypothetical protein
MRPKVEISRTVKISGIINIKASMVSLAGREHRSDREGTGEGRQDGVRTERDHI